MILEMYPMQVRLTERKEKFPATRSVICIDIDDLLLLVNLAFAAKRVSGFEHVSDKSHDMCPKCILGAPLSSIDFTGCSVD